MLFILTNVKYKLTICLPWQRLPIKSSESTVLDPALRLTNASNVASLASAELAAVANVFETGHHVGHADIIASTRPLMLLAWFACIKGIWASNFVQVARGSGIVPIASVIPVHQLVSWSSANVKSELVRRIGSSLRLTMYHMCITHSKPIAVFR